jgi:hypothetical protein
VRGEHEPVLDLVVLAADLIRVDPGVLEDTEPSRVAGCRLGVLLRGP